ncbi:hypothetical protein [Inhella sp.]|uniref:hypothetical protein n=1 Tax=Inhella sp. TaxID=1921806 RepID=UPI0035B100A4
MPRQMPQLLLLLLTLTALSLAAHRLAGLPLPAAAALLLAGVLAQGFASYKPPAPDFFEPRRGLGPALAWLLRAALGIAALCGVLLGLLWVLRNTL